MWATLRTLGWLCWLAGYLIGRLPAYWKARRLAKKGRTAEHDALVRHQVSKWAPKLLRHIKCSVEVRGAENVPQDEVIAVASNHQSFIDIPVLLASLNPPVPLLSKDEIGKIPMLGGWMRELGCIFLKRDDVRAGMEVMKQAETHLRGGRSLTIFPEGTRSKDGRLGEYKAGVVRIASKAGVRILPVVLDGTSGALEDNRFRVKPARVRITILPPVETGGLSREEQKALPQKLQAMAEDVMAGYREEDKV